MGKDFRTVYSKAAEKFFSRFDVMPRVQMMLQHTPAFLEVYVPPLIKGRDGNIIDMAGRDLINLGLSEKSQFLFCAEQGGGKSSFLSFLALSLLHKNREELPLPVLLTSRELGNSEWIQNAIRNVFLLLDVRNEDLFVSEEELKQEKLLFLVDDFDILASEKQKEIEEILNNSSPWSWVIAITQDNPVPSFLNTVSFPSYALQPLTTAQMQQFCERWYKVVYCKDREKNEANSTLVQGLLENPSFKEFCEIRAQNEEKQAKLSFSGRRVHRGLFHDDKLCKVFHADTNGALNILKAGAKLHHLSLSSKVLIFKLASPIKFQLMAFFYKVSCESLFARIAGSST